MKKKYGIFEIDTKSKYLKDGLNTIEFLSERYLHDTEEDAIKWFPNYDGHFIIMPVYLTSDQKDYEDYIKKLEQEKEFWKKRIK